MAIDIDIDYSPQPKQLKLHTCPGNEILYGGAAGPGKSHALRMEALMWCLRIPNLQVYIFRRTFREIEDNHVLPSQMTYPREMCRYKEQKKRWEFTNGSRIHFCHCQHEKDVFMFHGAEIHLLLLDELTTFTEFQYDYLRGRNRCTLDIPDKYKHKVPGIIAASNPGGVGHQFAKQRWVDYAPPMELAQAPGNEGGMLRCYIPGLLEDNMILMERDPGYIHKLDALPEPYRTAYKEGNWDIFLGQMFAFNRQEHVIKPMPVPIWAHIYMTFDWGFGKPYSVGWWWVDSEARVYRFSELYGAMGGMVDTGLRQSDEIIADKIIEQEERIGIKGRDIIRLSDPTCMNKKPDYKGGGQGPSTAEIFAQKGIIMSPGDPSRILKIRQFHSRLRTYDDQAPMMLIYENCHDFIRTIPLLQAAEKNPEDVNTDMEDHIYDEACHICMARPLVPFEPTRIKTPAQKDWDIITNNVEANETESAFYMDELE